MNTGCTNLLKLARESVDSNDQILVFVPEFHSSKEHFKFTFCRAAGTTQDLKWRRDCATENVEHNLQYLSSVKVMQ